MEIQELNHRVRVLLRVSMLSHTINAFKQILISHLLNLKQRIDRFLYRVAMYHNHQTKR